MVAEKIKYDNRVVSFLDGKLFVALENYMAINANDKSGAIRGLLKKALEAEGLLNELGNKK